MNKKIWFSSIGVVILIIVGIFVFSNTKETVPVQDIVINTPAITATTTATSTTKVTVPVIQKPIVIPATTTPTTPSQLKVTRPNGGEGLIRGETINITWDMVNPLSDITIYLYTNLSGCAYAGSNPCLTVVDPEYVITSNAENNGVFRWKIDQPAGTKYFLKICEGAGTTKQICDISDKTFSIFELTKPPYVLTVTSPNVEETWKLGTTHTMSWELRGEIPGKYQVGLYLSATSSGLLGVFNASSKNSYTSIIESAFYGDVGKTLTPGKYKVNVMLFDGPINQGNGNPAETWGKVVAEDSSDVYVNIVK